MITTEQIKQLRDDTGVSVMQCKRALEESGGDIEKALIVLRKQAGGAASKKSGRALGAGTVAAYIHAGASVGAMVELLCETDFVAKNKDFQSLAHDIAMHVAATAPGFLRKEDISEEEYARAKEVFAKEVKDSGKPEDVKERMLAGKIDAYASEKALLEQSFIKDPAITIGGLIEQAVQKFGERTEIGRFARFEV